MLFRSSPHVMRQPTSAKLISGSTPQNSGNSARNPVLGLYPPWGISLHPSPLQRYCGIIRTHITIVKNWHYRLYRRILYCTSCRCWCGLDSMLLIYIPNQYHSSLCQPSCFTVTIKRRRNSLQALTSKPRGRTGGRT